MNGDYVRSHYQVPAKRGGRVVFGGQPGVITGAYARLRFDGNATPSRCTPPGV
ncbi:hypothetical protein Actkin_01057 [Actinokineospora sp. UTMC 2448]|nr:hypothetical protein Actkin_01057 [Actinokineospora sp. UTMC 2448]